MLSSLRSTFQMAPDVKGCCLLAFDSLTAPGAAALSLLLFQLRKPSQQMRLNTGVEFVGGSGVGAKAEFTESPRSQGTLSHCLL